MLQIPFQKGLGALGWNNQHLSKVWGTFIVCGLFNKWGYEFCCKRSSNLTLKGNLEKTWPKLRFLGPLWGFQKKLTPILKKMESPQTKCWYDQGIICAHMLGSHVQYHLHFCFCPLVSSAHTKKVSKSLKSTIWPSKRSVNLKDLGAFVLDRSDPTNFQSSKSQFIVTLKNPISCYAFNLNTWMSQEVSKWLVSGL